MGVEEHRRRMDDVPPDHRGRIVDEKAAFPRARGRSSLTGALLLGTRLPCISLEKPDGNVLAAVGLGLGVPGPYTGSMRNLLWFAVAAAAEIAGCFAAWMWLRLGRSVWWIVPGTCSLIVFALVLTRVDAIFAGRAFAAYGGVYIVGSLIWLALVERTAPRAPDVIGSAVCLIGAAIILYGTRA